MFGSQDSLCYSAGRRFEPILTDNGLADWHCFPENLANDWSVKDGQLIGRSSGKGSYLMWKGGDL